MAKPISRKERIRKKARERRMDVQGIKIKKLSNNINKLEKRLEALERGGGPN